MIAARRRAGGREQLLPLGRGGRLRRVRLLRRGRGGGEEETEEGQRDKHLLHSDRTLPSKEKTSEHGFRQAVERIPGG